MKKRPKAAVSRGARVVGVAHRVDAEEERPHRAAPRCTQPRRPCRAQRGAQPGFELRAERLEALVGAGLVEQRRASPGRRRRRADSRTACRPGRRAPSGASCCMTSRRPPNAASGRPPPMTLPRQVRSGRMPSRRLHAAPGEPEAGHHLVEDQQRAVRCGDRGAAPRGSPAAGGTRPMLPTTGSTITAAMASPVGGEARLDLGQVVEARHQRLARRWPPARRRCRARRRSSRRSRRAPAGRRRGRGSSRRT